MATSWLSNYFGNAALHDYLSSVPNYLSLHSSDPGVSGTLSTEFTGGGYGRQRTKWSAPNNKTIATTNSQIFHDLNQGTVNYLGVWDATNNGHLLFRVKVTPGVFVPSSGQFTALAGDVALTV